MYRVRTGRSRIDHKSYKLRVPRLGRAQDTSAKIDILGVAEWLAHWLLVLEVPGSIPAGGEENLLVRTCFPSCHLQE